MEDFDLHAPPSHPRAKSLLTRGKSVKGFKSGIVVPAGLIAHVTLNVKAGTSAFNKAILFSAI